MRVMQKRFFLAALLWVVLFFPSKACAQNYKDIFSQAVQYAQKGEHEKAIEFLEKVVELNPNFAPAYNFLGMSYQEAGLDPIEVAWYFKAAVDIDPTYELALINLGKAYYGLGHFDLAEKHTARALEINPESVNAMLSLGWIYLLGKSRPDDAVQYFQMVLERVKHPSAYFGLGMAYFMSGDTPRVLESITRLREMKQDPLAEQLELVIRGKEYAAQTQKDQALIPEAQTRADPLTITPVGSQMSMGPAGPMRVTVQRTMPVRLNRKFDFNQQTVLGDPVPRGVIPSPKPPDHTQTKVLTSE
ncbi:MAG: tetratricopeptide repeat protein [Candidatus Aceula meridiana]|nr:tetratricopeptide repeat protein [Candidatus Aceula meridiana]